MKKDIETMMQMVYLRFTKPRFDADAYDIVIQNFNNMVLGRSENIQDKIEDSVTVALYGENDTKKRLFNQQFVKDISFDKVKSIYSERFGNAADFEFFIVGDVEKEILKPLLEKYIAGIATAGNKEQWKDNSVSWMAPNTAKTVHLKMADPKTSVEICYKNSLNYSLKNQILARTVGDMLRLRYNETLREEEGGTYGASTMGGMSKRPLQEAFVMVKFDCNPDKADKLISIVHQEINKIATGEINQTDLDKTLANYLKDRKQEKDLNTYDMELLTNFYREDYNMEKPENFESIVKSITKKDLTAFTAMLLKKAKSYEIVFKPLL